MLPLWRARRLIGPARLTMRRVVAGRRVVSALLSMRSRIVTFFAPLPAPPSRRIESSLSVIASPRRVVARRVVSASLSMRSRILRLFAPLGTFPGGRIVTLRGVIGSPFTARRRFIAPLIFAFIASLIVTFIAPLIVTFIASLIFAFIAPLIFAFITTFSCAFGRGAVYVFWTRRWRGDAIRPSVIRRARRTFNPFV